MKKLTIACGLVLALSACSTEDAAPIQEVRPMSPKIMMDVQTINLADRSGAQPMSSPYATNHFAPTIADAIKGWAGDRLQATGQAGRAIVIIKDASLSAQPLQMATGFDSWFTRQQALKYTGHAEVSVEANGPSGFAVTDATATRSVTLPENPTATEKQDAYYSLINGLMKDLGINLESGMQEHMSKFIITAPIYGSTAVPTTSVVTPTPMAMTAPKVSEPIVSAPMMTAPAIVTAPSVEPQPMAMNAPALPAALVSIPSAAPVSDSVSPPEPIYAPMVAPAPVSVPNTAPVPSYGKVTIPLSGPMGQ